MSANRIMAEMGKSGSLSRYSRRFHSLTRDAKQKALDLIASGTAIEKALRMAKRGN